MPYADPIRLRQFHKWHLERSELMGITPPSQEDLEALKDRLNRSIGDCERRVILRYLEAQEKIKRQLAAPPKRVSRLLKKGVVRVK